MPKEMKEKEEVEALFPTSFKSENGIKCSICGDSFTGVFRLELLRTAKYGTILFPKPKLIVCGNCLAQKFESPNENFYNWFYSLSK